MSRVLPRLALCLAVVAGCSQAPRLESSWRQFDIAVDGTDAEWPQTRYVLETPVPVTVGVVNDATHLYLTVVTADRQLQRRVLISGIEVWLDPKGGTHKHVGLRLPGLDRASLSPGDAGQERPGPLGLAERAGGRRGSGARGPEVGEIPLERFAALFSAWQAQGELRLVDAEDDEGTPLHAAAADLQLCAHYDQGRLVLEARLPLNHSGYPMYTVERGGHLGVALRVPEQKQPTRDDEFRPGVGRPGGGMGGMGGGMTPGDDGRRRPTSVNAEPLQRWVKVQLEAGS